MPPGLTDNPLLNSRFILYGAGNNRIRALRWIKRRGNSDIAAALIHAMRFARPTQRDDLVQTLQSITKKRYGDDWLRWMQWLQANPGIEPFAGFDVFLSALFGSLDPGFKDFIYPGVKHAIRLEEVVWGGVPVALAYCTLCGSGILYDTSWPDGNKPLIFGSSGLLYQSNKLMFPNAYR